MATPPRSGDGRRCSRCKQAEAAASHYWCRACQNAHRRLWEIAQAGVLEDFRAYKRAWNTTRRAMYRTGHRPPCPGCGRKASPFVIRPRRPYRVEWWCRDCRHAHYPDRHYTGAPQRPRAGAPAGA